MVALANANAGVTKIAVGSGVLATLPPNAPYPAWTTHWYGLMTPNGLQSLLGGGSKINCQVDAYGENRADVVNLTAAIKTAWHGFRGTLTDPDTTYVDICRLIDLRDLDEDSDGRVFRRMSEYEIRFHLK